jgi:uncharacterized protein YndB with AHSA1/START domain
MPDIFHKVGIKAPIAKVYNSLATAEGVKAWWTQEISGESKLGGTLIFFFRNDDGSIKGEMHAEVMALAPNKRVQWLVKSGPKEWVGTTITFDLSEADGYTIVLFAHRKWREEVEFMGHCSMKWATFLLSLKQLGETGKGRPAPDDIKIDNWN